MNQAEVAPAEISRSIEALRAFWAQALRPHFEAEENLLLPALRSQGQAGQEEIELTLDEHRQLAGLFQEITCSEDLIEVRHKLAQFAELLIQHIRFEERKLFARVAELLSGPELDLIGQQLAKRYQALNPARSDQTG